MRTPMKSVSNLVPRGLWSYRPLAPGGGEMRDSGNEARKYQAFTKREYDPNLSLQISKFKLGRPLN